MTNPWWCPYHRGLLSQRRRKRKRRRRRKRKRGGSIDAGSNRKSSDGVKTENDGVDAAGDDDDDDDEEWEYRRGKDVYVEFEDMLYRCTILNRRLKKGSYQYFVYWNGFKKTHNSWVKDDDVQKITAYSSRRFNKQSIEESSETDEEEEWEYPIGKDVYVEFDDLLYRATVLNRRMRKGSYQYLVHYDGFKKGADSWVKEKDVHKITAYTSRRFNKQSFESEEETEEEVESAAEEEMEEEEEEEFPNGVVVYVEFRDVLYRATVLDKRIRKGEAQYFVHYDGYKKTSDRWVKYADVHKRTAYTSRRYNKQRKEEAAASQNAASDSKSTASASSKSKAPAPSEFELSDEEGNKILDMKGIQSGVEFLPGSSVFVKWNEALYLAKMVKRRVRAGETQYFITYNGFRDSSNAWVPLSNIYEINPRTRKIFEKKDTKQVRTKTSVDHLNKVTAAGSKKRAYSRQSSIGSASQAGLGALEGVESGVPFLPGSTLFAKVGDELHLAKMVKKRGDIDDMEYFISYTKRKRTVDAWVPVTDVYEINAQTKRIYNKNK